MSNVFDFRPGMNGWGHAIHSETFRKAEPGRAEDGTLIDRASVIVHCRPSPTAGDLVLYEGRSGTQRRCAIVEVIAFRDPDDMFTLVLEERADS